MNKKRLSSYEEYIQLRWRVHTKLDFQLYSDIGSKLHRQLRLKYEQLNSQLLLQIEDHYDHFLKEN